MTEKELFEHLCINDPRSPYFDAEAAEGRKPGVDCSCDDCFTGRHELVMALLSGKRTETWVLRLGWYGEKRYCARGPMCCGDTDDILEAQRFKTKPESSIGIAVRVMVVTTVEEVTCKS